LIAKLSQQDKAVNQLRFGRSAGRRAGWTLGFVLLIVIRLPLPQAEGAITAENVNKAIDEAVELLRSRQDPQHGNWSPHTGFPGGVTALCTLALLNAGVPADDPTVRSALDHLRSLGNPGMTYCTALQTMAFCRAEPDKHRLLIRRNVDWLEGTQIRNGDRRGGWSYGSKRGTVPDNSNSQFALLALHEADQQGVQVQLAVWKAAYEYWLGEQNEDGSWGYRQGAAGTGSMTSAGISSIYIASRELTRGDAAVTNSGVMCCGIQQPDAAMQRGLAWLGRNFSAQQNPTAKRSSSLAHFYYYLYGVERVGRLTGHRFLARHDWYREGAEALLSRQDRLTQGWQGAGGAFGEGKPEVATALSLLFLSKGRRPVLLAKLRSGEFEDWNHHRRDVGNLTRYVETQWEQEMTWQVVDIRAATAEDLAQAPVLFISGRDGLNLSLEQREVLREYITNGGFIFAEACCRGDGFDRDFRELVANLFPDNPLELLPPKHPIWFAEKRIDPRYVRPLLGIEACCRTSIVYCPKDLGCYWELARRREMQYSPKVEREVQAVLDIGANVLAYATNRELRDKLDNQGPIERDQESFALDRGAFYIPKLDHGGGSDDAPAALVNLLRMLSEEIGDPVVVERRLLSPTDTTLPDYPVAFLHGRRSFRWSDEERAAVGRFVKGGGVLLGDAICASREFADAFRREMKAIFPDRSLETVPTSHRMFSKHYGGFDIENVRVRIPRRRDSKEGRLEADIQEVSPNIDGIMTEEGRYAVLFSPLDLSCALENHASLECKGYIREDAIRIGMNLLLYAMQQ